MLICVVVERTVTRCGAKLKTPIVKQNSFELERKGKRFSQPDWKRGQMDYPSLPWKEKSSNGFEFRLENGFAIQFFRNSSVRPTANTSTPPPTPSKQNKKNDGIGKKDNRSQER